MEQPIRHAHRLQLPTATFAAAASAVMVVAALPFTPWLGASRVQAASDDPATGPPAGGLERLLADKTATAPAPPHRARETDGSRLAAVPAPRRWRPGTRLVVDVFGDSLPWSLVTALPTHRGIDVRDRTILGCGIVLSAPYQYFGHTYPHVYQICRGWSRHWRQALSNDRPHLAVVMVGRWETMTRTFRGRWRALGDPVYDRYLRQRLHHAIVVAGSTGARVVLATLPYNRRGERPDGGLFPEDEPARVTAWNRLLRDVAADHAGVAVLDIGHRITPENKYAATAGGYPMRTDGLHLASDGVRNWIAPWLYPKLVELASPRPDPQQSSRTPG